MIQTSKIGQFLKMFVLIGLLVGLVIYIVTINQTSDNTMGWTCIDKTCIQELGGTYDSQETCLKTCTAAETLKYACDSLGNCVSSTDGSYDEDTCSGECVQPDEPITTTYNCEDGSCVPVEGNEGKYATSECLTTDSTPLDACEKIQPWTFNETAQTCNGVGSKKTTMRQDMIPYNPDAAYYVSQDVCESQADFSAKYSCENGSCIPKGNIPMSDGLYKSEEDCTADCISDKSQCSDTNVTDGVCCGQTSIYNYTCHNKTTEWDCKSTEHCCWKQQKVDGIEYGDGKYDVCPWSCQVKNEKAQKNTDDCFFPDQYKCFFSDFDESQGNKQTIYNMTPRGDPEGKAVGKDGEDGSCQGKKFDGSTCCRWVPYVEKSFPGDDWNWSSLLPCIKEVTSNGTVKYHDECLS